MASYGLHSYMGRARLALLFKEHSTLWAAFGRTTEWVDEDDPDVLENPLTVESLEEPIVYVKSSFVSLCKQVDDNGDVTVGGQDYEFVEDEDAISEEAMYLYSLYELNGPGGMPTGTYRQVAVFSNVVPAAGHASDDWLLPEDVDDFGNIEYMANRTKIVFTSGEVRQERVIIEFN